MKRATAYANANIALVKYWGKSNHSLNIPAVPSLSMTLDGLGTTTTLLSGKSSQNQVKINGHISSAQVLNRTNNFLDYFYNQFGVKDHLEIVTQSSVPFAAGLASSASYFASLSLALNNYFCLNLNQTELAELARRGSASAARSLFSGFVGLVPTDTTCSIEILKTNKNLDLALVVAICNDQPKKLSSRTAMEITQQTSPYFAAFVESSHQDYAQAKSALEAGLLKKIGQIMEHSTLKMHAAMWAAIPAINYLSPKTIEIMNFVDHLRNSLGIEAYFTMDAGPNVKILCEKQSSAPLAQRLKDELQVTMVHISQPGRGAHLINDHLI